MYCRLHSYHLTEIHVPLEVNLPSWCYWLCFPEGETQARQAHALCLFPKRVLFPPQECTKALHVPRWWTQGEETPEGAAAQDRGRPHHRSARRDSHALGWGMWGLPSRPGGLHHPRDWSRDRGLPRINAQTVWPRKLRGSSHHANVPAPFT